MHSGGKQLLAPNLCRPLWLSPNTRSHTTIIQTGVQCLAQGKIEQSARVQPGPYNNETTYSTL